MNKPHKHAELIKAWADGAEVEYWSESYKEWSVEPYPNWYDTSTYRIKPEPKPDVVRYGHIMDNRYGSLTLEALLTSNIKFIFDGETGALKGAEVL